MTDNRLIDKVALITGSDSGRLAVFLASADADYVTGSTYVMDGGLMQNQGQGA